MNIEHDSDVYASSVIRVININAPATRELFPISACMLYNCSKISGVVLKVPSACHRVDIDSARSPVIDFTIINRSSSCTPET
ncbi:unnamed protein product [Macrosiphum euphorbiae]|uniref:Uncharacterized protein n=1 Tax=Macrosiphum euphorbiae TaxID=13131 RepID=A0AAV0WEY2_9HEMI|nr:unnamed protein product [Macrosiphum euphorbiae]